MSFFSKDELTVEEIYLILKNSTDILSKYRGGLISANEVNDFLKKNNDKLALLNSSDHPRAKEALVNFANLHNILQNALKSQSDDLKIIGSKMIMLNQKRSDLERAEDELVNLKKKAQNYDKYRVSPQMVEENKVHIGVASIKVANAKDALERVKHEVQIMISTFKEINSRKGLLNQFAEDISRMELKLQHNYR